MPPDRISHDGPTVQTHRARLESQGQTGRVQVSLPDAVGVDSGEVVRVVLDGTEHHARVERALGADGLAIREVVDSPTLAREPGSGTDRLSAWVDEHGLAAGRSVLVDELAEGFQYGLREPGGSAVYTVAEPPRDSLADIAQEIKDG